MSSFDSKTKFLILGNKPLDPVIKSYEDSDHYKSYKKYLEKGLKEDIENILIPSLNELLKDKGIDLESHDSMITIQKEESFMKHVKNTVKLSLVEKGAIDFYNREDGLRAFTFKDKKLNPFTLLELPYMDKSGILYNNGKEYVVINSLTLEDNLTFNGKELKLVDTENSLTISGITNPKVTMFNSSITMVDFAIMLAKYYYNEEDGFKYSKEFIYSLRNNTLINSIAGTNKDYSILGDEAFDFLIDSTIQSISDQRAKEFQLLEKVENGYLSTTTTRRYLNEILSFNNAIGKTISRDVVTGDGKTIAETGEKVNALTVAKLNRNFIDTIYVKKSVNLVGQYIAKAIFLGNKIIKGTPVIPQMINLIPELEEYSVAPKTYELGQDQVLLIAVDTVITKELCEYLEYIGIEYFEYKEKTKSKKVLKAYFEEEYINNRHFPVSDLDIEDKDSYDDFVYVDKNLVINQESDTLTFHDVTALTSLFLKLIAGEHHDLVSDPDAGLRKRVEQVYDHFHKAFEYSTKNLVRRGGATLKRIVEDKTNLNDSDKMNRAFKYFTKDFFRHLQSGLKIIDMLNITNPVATISSLTKINTIVKDEDSISDSMRRLTMGHYGRICPYETPQSKKLGIVNNVASGCTIEDGIMYTSYYPLYHSDGITRIGDTPVRMSVADEEKYRIADIGELDYDVATRVVKTKGKVLSRVSSTNNLEKMTIAHIDLKDVQYVSVSTNQHESIACTTVPYAGADDATRVSFGMSMVKQAKGLVNGEVPIICTTGFLNIPNMNTYYKIFAEKSGRVTSVSSMQVVIKYDDEPMPVAYNFEPMTISSTSTIIRVAEVVVNERVVQGQTLVSSNFIKDGSMVIGVNALVAYVTDGYNYEDGVPCSKRLSNKLTSYGVHTDTFSISKNTIRAEIQDVKYESYISKEDRIFTKNERLGKSNDYSKSIMRSDKCRGFIAGTELVRDNMNPSKYKEIKIRSVSFDELNKSDKICNRHGNKGVLCKIHDNSDMEYLDNGEFIDIKYNPNGIVSRMNIGQTLEAPSGLACYVLGINILCDSFNSPDLKDNNMLLSYTVDLANSDDEEEVFRNYPELPKELHDHCRENIKKIRHWKGTFNKEGKAYLIDPKSGKRTLKRVNIGINYVYKLVQEGESKMHSRGGYLTSPYVFKTESPTKGASNGGGQRMGYMELDALAAYGSSAVLKEITNERSDNYIARNNVTVKALHSDDPSYLLNEKDGIRRSSEYMFELFKSLGMSVDMTEDELNLRKPENRKYYKRRSLLDASLDGESAKDDDITSLLSEIFNKDHFGGD